MVRRWLVMSGLLVSWMQAHDQADYSIKGPKPVSTTGTLYSFGQNVIEKGKVRAYLYVDSLLGPCKNFSELFPSVIYGVRDDLSVSLSIPVAVKFRVGQCATHALEDMLLQAEYAYYQKKERDCINQATIVGAVTLPTGKADVTPPTGLGLPSFFIGVTAQHATRDWYLFMFQGALLTTHHEGLKVGNQYFYQFGTANNFFERKGWQFRGMVELFGVYNGHARRQGILDSLSSSHVLFLAPSLRVVSEGCILQLGCAFVLTQRQHDHRLRNRFWPAGLFGWKF